MMSIQPYVQRAIEDEQPETGSTSTMTSLLELHKTRSSAHKYSLQDALQVPVLTEPGLARMAPVNAHREQTRWAEITQFVIDRSRVQLSHSAPIKFNKLRKGLCAS